MANQNPWRWCTCGHMMLLHDVDDMDGTNPTCCVDGCDQNGCRQQDKSSTARNPSSEPGER